MLAMRRLHPPAHVDAITRAGSLREAAEELAITATALDRRCVAPGDEPGVPLFERKPRGVRLPTAGTLLTHPLRTQAADLETFRGVVGDRRGARRCDVPIACSPAFLARLPRRPDRPVPQR
jgi:DNA-binding transcriptional LysR family regulator